MTRGTTPTFTFTLEDETIDLALAESVYVTFRQGRRTLRKTGGELTVSGYTVTVTLTQEESLAFLTGQEPVYVQLNWVYDDSSRACSETVRVRIKDNLEPEVLS